MKNKYLKFGLTAYAISISLFLGWLHKNYQDQQLTLEYYKSELRSVRFDRPSNIDSFEKSIQSYRECRELIEKLEYDKLKSSD